MDIPRIPQLLRVFEHITGLPERTSRAIFFSHKSDKAQRDLVGAVAEALEVREAERLVLKKLLNRLDKAAAKRNLAAHTIFGVKQGWANDGALGAKVVPALGPEHDQRLAEDFAAQFGEVEQGLREIYKAFGEWLMHTPYPNRPWGHPPFPGQVPMFAFDPLDDEPAASA